MRGPGDGGRPASQPLSGKTPPALVGEFVKGSRGESRLPQRAGWRVPQPRPARGQGREPNHDPADDDGDPDTTNDQVGPTGQVGPSTWSRRRARRMKRRATLGLVALGSNAACPLPDRLVVAPCPDGGGAGSPPCRPRGATRCASADETRSGERRLRSAPQPGGPRPGGIRRPSLRHCWISACDASWDGGAKLSNCIS